MTGNSHYFLNKKKRRRSGKKRRRRQESNGGGNSPANNSTRIKIEQTKRAGEKGAGRNGTQNRRMQRGDGPRTASTLPAVVRKRERGKRDDKKKKKKLKRKKKKQKQEEPLYHARPQMRRTRPTKGEDLCDGGAALRRRGKTKREMEGVRKTKKLIRGETGKKQPRKKVVRIKRPVRKVGGNRYFYLGTKKGEPKKENCESEEKSQL